jgi:hypothetical protein
VAAALANLRRFSLINAAPGTSLCSTALTAAAVHPPAPEVGVFHGAGEVALGAGERRTPVGQRDLEHGPLRRPTRWVSIPTSPDGSSNRYAPRSSRGAPAPPDQARDGSQAAMSSAFVG